VDQEKNQQVFMQWAESRVPDARYMNSSSGAQVRQGGLHTQCKAADSLLCQHLHPQSFTGGYDCVIYNIAQCRSGSSCTQGTLGPPQQNPPNPSQVLEVQLRALAPLPEAPLSVWRRRELEHQQRMGPAPSR
jgi:hypothetical protein